jgi:hypothetical protein
MALAWFVGYNTDQGSEASVGQMVTGSSPSGYESLHAGNVADNAQFLAAAATNKVATKPVTISVENISWWNINGPYATQAQANAAIPAINKANPSQGYASQLADSAQGKSATTPVTNPLDYLEDVGDFFHRLTEAATWERVGEVAVGVLLLYIGVKALAQNTAIGKSAKKSSSTGKKIFEALAVPK